MMYNDLIKDGEIRRKIRSGSITREELGEHLAKCYTISELTNALSYYVIKEAGDNPGEVLISQEQFDAFFRIIGTKRLDDGTVVKENRGRREGTKVVGGKVVRP